MGEKTRLQNTGAADSTERTINHFPKMTRIPESCFPSVIITQGALSHLCLEILSSPSKTKKQTKKNNNKMDLIRLWIEFRRRKKKVLMSGKQENK
jgi:hypothetical protein